MRSRNSESAESDSEDEDENLPSNQQECTRCGKDYSPGWWKGKSCHFFYISEKVLRVFNVSNSYIDGDTILCISCAQFSIKDPIHQKNQLLSSKVVR